MGLAQWHRRFVDEGPGSLLDYLASCLLFPLSFLFGVIAKVRQQLYHLGWLASYRAPVPVISVGNIAVGGTGKTPVTDLLVKILQEKGIKVAVVSRGYGRKSREPVTVVCAGSGPIVTAEEGGDEPVLLAQRNPTTIVIVAADRQQGIRKAITDYAAEIILLDDGYQHLKVQRDLDILLLDAAKPFGNGFPLPFGLLREFPSAVKRADLFILTRSEGGETLSMADKPVLRARYILAKNVVDSDGETTRLKSLSPGRIGAFAGIANPGSFFAALGAAGINLSETLSFTDHVVYSASEKARLHGLAVRCDVLLTTEKDLVKLQQVDLPCDCLAVPLELSIVDGNKKLTNLIDTFLDQYKEQKMLPAELVEILACPRCKGEVNYNNEAEKVGCRGCKLAYPVRDGIPVMLMDEAENFKC